MSFIQRYLILNEPIPLPMAIPEKKTKSIMAILAVLEPSGDTSEMYAYKPEKITIEIHNYCKYYSNWLQSG